ncbi:hypothetical protein GJ744_007870 [Endocarpon pusillum]|uniref:DUF7587 domain-containing protein n=1 Tax=Endocarpon pusillum TaxID=364733 RepID=A0A8H7E805_9EURO|nr:hypothetical protein GJ744_007870 [Endocarpon pusillum]
MESINEQKPRHKWQVGHRHLLCLFSKLYGNNIDDMTRILNHILANELSAEGFDAGMPTSTVRGQLLNIKQGASGYDVWQKVVLNPSIAEARKIFREGRDAIEDAALALGIGLHLRTEDVDRKPHGKRLGKRGRKIEELRGVLGDIISSDDDSGSETSPSGQGHGQLLTPISLQSGVNTPGVLCETSSARRIVTNDRRVTTTPRKATTKSQDIPRLVFRWYNDRSQGFNTPTELLAGKFLDQPQEIPPPEWALEAVRNHLVPHKLPSPFISFRESLRPCLFRALKAGVKTNPCIAIVDLHKLKDLTCQKWGNYEAIKACPDLIKHFNLTLGKEGTYTGSGEWLVYGKIGKEAIVSTIKISEFNYYERRVPLLAQILQLNLVRAAPTARKLSFKMSESPADMTWDSGVAVGSLMNYLRVPDEYWKDVGDNIAESWAFRGWKRRRFNQGYEAYMNGIMYAKDNPDNLLDVEGVARVGKRDVVKVSGTRSTIMAEHTSQLQSISPEKEQELIDAQLHAELASFLWDSGSPHEGIPCSNNRTFIANGFRNRDASSRPRPESRQRTTAARFARPRSSSLFTFTRPTIPGPATDWEAANSGDVLPAATERSALDIFTTELLAKAEDCSSSGSFGRRSTTTQLPSEAQVSQEEEYSARENSPENVLDEDSVVIDLSSDDDDDSVEDLGFEIVGSRRIEK